MTALAIVRVILYVRDIPTVAAFYQLHFGMRPLESTEPGWQELMSPHGGCAIALHQAAVSQKRGSEIKMVFAVKDVRAFTAACAAQGLHFGVVHTTATHEFANAKDPAGNAIQVSSRGVT